MPVGVPSSLSSINPKTLIALTGFGALFCLAYPFGLSAPYHADTAAYMLSVHHFLQTTELESFYPTRPLAGFLLIPLAPLLGDKTLPVTMALAFGAGGVLGAMVFWRLFKNVMVVAGFFVALFCPAALISTTHGKEDPLAVALVMGAALLLTRGGLVRAFIAGGVFGLALMTKENVLALYPFVLGAALVSPLTEAAKPESSVLRPEQLRASGARMLLAAIASLCVVFLISPSHFSLLLALGEQSSTGQFLGLFSDRQSTGFRQWRQALGAPAYYAQLAGTLVLIIDRTPRGRLLGGLCLLQGVALGLFLANTTVSHFRHFLWPALFLLPMATYGLHLLGRCFQRDTSSPRVQLGIGVGSALVIIFSLWSVFPAVSLRGAFNPIETFFRDSPLGSRKTLALGMDSCPLAHYFTGARCLTHPKSPDENEARQFARRIERAIANGKAVYLLPDFFTFDRERHLAGEIHRRFILETAYENWFEDYHRLDDGISVAALDRFRTRKMEAGCTLLDRPARKNQTPPGQQHDFVVRCEGKSDLEISARSLGGKALVGFQWDKLSRLTPRIIEIVATRAQAGEKAQTVCAGHGTYGLLEAETPDEMIYRCVETGHEIHIVLGHREDNKHSSSPQRRVL